MTEPQISDEAVEAGNATLAEYIGEDGTTPLGELVYEPYVRRVLAAAVPHLYRQWEAELAAELRAEFGVTNRAASWLLRRDAQPGGQP